VGLDHTALASNGHFSTGLAIHRSRLRRRWRRTQSGSGKAARIGRRVTNHGLRHTVGTVLGEHLNAFEVQAFLGHADLSTTRRYVRDTADGLREAARVLELASPRQVTAT
jgi:integrase